MSATQTARSIWKMSGADYLALRVVTIGVTALVALAALVSFWPGSAVSFDAAAPGEQGPAFPLPGGNPGVTAQYDDTLTWTIADPSLGQRFLAALPMLFLLNVVVGAGVLLWQLTDAVRAGRPFTRDNVLLLRVLALLVVGYGVLMPFVRLWCSFLLQIGSVADASVAVSGNLSEFFPVLVGLLMLALVEVFVRGVQLSDDVEGLV